MKTNTIILALLFLSISITAGAQGTVYNFVKGYGQGLGYSIKGEYHCNLKQGEACTQKLTFYKGSDYDVLAFSEDGDVQDIDVKILTSYNTTYVEDNSAKDYAEVTFSPSFTRSLTIRVKNYSSNTPYYASKIYFIVFYK